MVGQRRSYLGSSRREHITTSNTSAENIKVPSHLCKPHKGSFTGVFFLSFFLSLSLFSLSLCLSLGYHIKVANGGFLLHPSQFSSHNNPTFRRYLTYTVQNISSNNVRVVITNVSSISPFAHMLRLNTFRTDVACLFLVIVSDECTYSRRDMLRIHMYTCQ